VENAVAGKRRRRKEIIGQEVGVRMLQQQQQLPLPVGRRKLR
jgi:hypothetical protein